MFWGITEANTAPRDWDTPDLAAELIVKMTKWNPSYVMALLQNPDAPENASEEVMIAADHLARAEDASAAAWLLMEQLRLL